MTGRARDALSFTPDLSLLNPKFESYKLRLVDDDVKARSHRLPATVRLAPVADYARLSYEEAQERARHNHLSPGQDGSLVYIDASLRVIAVQMLAVSSMCAVLRRTSFGSCMKRSAAG